MADLTREALVDKLNTVAVGSLDRAYAACRQRGTPSVELVHWIQEALAVANSDVARIVDGFGVEPSRLARDLTEAAEAFPRGASFSPAISPHIDSAMERGWVYASLMFGASSVRTGHLLMGILATATLRQMLHQASAEFRRISADDLRARWESLVAGSVEDRGEATSAPQPSGTATGSAAAPASSGGRGPGGDGKSALARFAVDLTAKARAGELDAVVGREEEIRQIVDVLMRRRQNNPLLAGEAGVGKTAVVEGLALRIAEGSVPPSLKNISLMVLDVGLMQAGAGVRGEFEQRLRSVIDEVQGSEKPIVLFIDEVHTLIGAGGAAGTGDAANLLKPALARGKLRTIAATTWAEYKKHIEPDPALTRRFQVIQVPEPDEAKALLMMRGLAGTLEKHHGVQILDEALLASVKLSHRYIPSRQLPDKSVSLLDTACARVAVGHHAVPPAVEDAQRRIEALESELAIVRREQAAGVDTGTRAEALAATLAGERDRLASLEARWGSEKKLVAEVVKLRAELMGASGAAGGGKPAEADGKAAEAKATAGDVRGSAAGAGNKANGEAVARLRALQAELRTLQGDSPLVAPIVDEATVASVVADWTGVPVGRMVRNEVETVLKLGDTLANRVIGQNHALADISKRILAARARLENPTKPVGVFLLVGPSGVGKTETALALAETLFGGEQNLITFNMSEFKEPHTVSQLKGAPPGYVGYGEGGLLTEAVRRRPHSVVLLDEFEKGHRAVHDLFLQVFDKGWMEDATGRFIDFSSTIILLTSNVGADAIMTATRDPDTRPDDPEVLSQLVRPHLLKAFPAELLGRMVVIPYWPLSDEMLASITRLQLRRIVSRLAENHGATLAIDDDAVKLVVSRCVEVESGGRMIDSIITNSLVPRISREILTRSLSGGTLRKVKVGVESGQFSYSFE